ncbi:MAG: alpha/beta hydrolase [Alphaproteobacteria bacterium]|nr:alpha/beta hydrolase [Alphaproteobacteria bacterium]
MPSDDIKKVREMIAGLPPRTGMSIPERRATMDAWDKAYPVADDVTVASAKVAEVPVEWITAPNASEDAVLLFLHGGGYVIGSPDSHRHLVANLSEETGLQGLLVDYRLAPEDPFPAAVEDAISVYAALLTHGFEAEEIVVAGDSAGGGLVVAMMLAIRDANLPLPAAGICLSPWNDLTGTAKSLETNASVDPTVTKESLDFFAGEYLGEEDAQNPYASPLFGDFTGLPPLLIQVGSVEVLLDDAVMLAERAKEAGVSVTLEIWDEMIHVWHRYYPVLQEAREANARIGEYVRGIVSVNAAAAE